MRQRIIFILLTLMLPSLAAGEERVERFPAPDFRNGHQMPQVQTPPTPWQGWQVIDVGVLAGALTLAAWCVLKKRSRRWVFALTVGSLLYFGFWRRGCICPVGSIQNVAWAAAGHGYALPWTVAAFFLLPLVFTLYYGRVFCSGVCPLGAIQDLVLFKPVHLPQWLESPLGLLAWAYLGLAVLFAATGSEFFICRYDPFVGLFRMSGPAHMILAGGIVLAACMFIGRLYCRFFCPYSVLLRLLAPFARRQVAIAPANCIDCRLCERSCPFNAIRVPSTRPKAHAAVSRRPQLALAMAAPALMIVFALLGYLASGALARTDFTVRLGEQIWQEERTGVRGATDEARAFRRTGQGVSELYASAALLQHRFAVGTPIFGAWMGLAIAGQILGPILRRRRTGYTADPSACVACARCFAACPVQVNIQTRNEEPVTV